MPGKAPRRGLWENKLIPGEKSGRGNLDPSNGGVGEPPQATRRAVGVSREVEKEEKEDKGEGRSLNRRLGTLN